MKKNELLTSPATWLALENIILNTILSEVSQMRKTYYMISLICGIFKYNTYESIYKTEADLENKLWIVTKEERNR